MNIKMMYNISTFKNVFQHQMANVNTAFGPGTANKRILHWWFKKFCKGDESLEDEECSGHPSEVDNDQ